VLNQVLAFAGKGSTFDFTILRMLVNIGLGVIYGFLSVGFLLFWDKEIGLHLVSITLLSAVANLSIKYAYVGPRPYWTDSRVLGTKSVLSSFLSLFSFLTVFFFFISKALECRTEFAFPSGYSQAIGSFLYCL
jgi:hypothetical protein